MLFEELDYRATSLGELSLRRRAEPRAGGVTVYEVKLGEEFLMSSLFTAGERALARLCLAERCGDELDVLVGGLGLGYTAAEALANPRTGSVLVVEALGEVIGWHRHRLVPLGERLSNHDRCRIVCGDFFALAIDPAEGFDHASPGRRFDAILLDIDHSPDRWLSAASQGFYEVEGLRRLARHLRAGGVFGMWSNDGPDPAFTARLRQACGTARAEVVSFENPYSGQDAACTVYIAKVGAII